MFATPWGCADPCVDDGFQQNSCPAQPTAGQTGGATDSGTGTDSVTATDDATMGNATQGGSQSGTGDTQDDSGTATDGNTDGETDSDSETDSETDSDSETGGALWCVDEDGDGHGDPDNCEMSDDPVDGSVPNGDDCDDSDANTFPGAAPNDDPEACMRDEDDDDWGDDMPPPGVDAGSDCADDSNAIFPGAAENETPADLCAEDADGDGWGDTMPPPGVDAGTDCADDNADIFPGAAENEFDPTLCAEDADGDGWGDTMPPPGVDAGTDCADDSADIFPGAAENEIDPSLCAEDEDGDGWGDLDPPPGVDAGTDCDDSNPNAFPGAAPNETPPTLCTVDDDGDGWGDANPGGGGGGGGGPQSGSDCHDSNADLNPDTLQLTAIAPYQGAADAPRTVETVGVDASLSTFVTLTEAGGGIPQVNIVSATLRDTGEIFANDLTNGQLLQVEYAATCGGGTGELVAAGPPYGADADIVCGLEFGDDGMLYGIDLDNNVLTFDPATGAVTNTVAVTSGGVAVDISSCGMARDCTTGALLFANGVDHTIYSVDTTTGEATVVRDLGAFFAAAWTPTGLEYDPVTRNAWLSVGGSLWIVDLDTVLPPVLAGFFGENVSNLQYLPICI